MFRVKTFDKISEKGLSLFPESLYEAGEAVENPEGVLLRSHNLHDWEPPKSLIACARAGAGVNNIPVEAYMERGIAVFNTPGANANAVKELTLAALFLSSRNIAGAVQWALSLPPGTEGIPALVEKEKSRFAGPEIMGKTLGVIGLGNIGVSVANDALALGMNVIGYDPFISVDAAWSLSRAVEKAESLESLLSRSDYITLHVPLTDSSRNMLDGAKFSVMKKGARILNFARGELVDEDAALSAIESGKLASYACDFPSKKLIGRKGVICTPHIGASTPESEENCAVMAVKQLMDFLETGAVKNSVNLPDCKLGGRRSKGGRLTIINRNVPNMVGQITSMLASESINIEDMINHNRGAYAYNIIDSGMEISPVIAARIQGINGVVKVRVI